MSIVEVNKKNGFSSLSSPLPWGRMMPRQRAISNRLLIPLSNWASYRVAWSFFASLELLRTQLAVSFFMEVIIWMQRYDFIFKGLHPLPLAVCLVHFKNEFVILRAKSRNKLAMSEWLEVLLYFFNLFLSFLSFEDFGTLLYIFLCFSFQYIIN